MAGATLVLAAVAAYHNSFDAVFQYDDIPAIVENKAIRQLWPLGEVFSLRQTQALSVGGRPLLSLSLAINYAISGLDVWSYHAFNLLVHALAGLTLFGLTRRTLQRPVLAARFGTAAFPLALVVAALWTLHPLQTESVTYIIQRAEAMMGLFYLLALYGFVRSVDSPQPRAWLAASIGACLLGACCKEVIVTAPVAILLYDRTFVAGSFREAWRRRHWYYSGLTGTWLLLAWLVISTGGDRGGAFIYTLKWIGSYWLTQFEAVARYLQLSLWPRPLIFDYGFFTVERVAELAVYAPLVLALVGATLWALWRKPVPGFLGAWFFLILAPTSLMPGKSQMIVEHRIYLSLAAVLVLAVTGLHAWLGRRGWWVGAVLAAGCGALTVQRNEAYRDDVTLWTDAVEKQPGNARAHHVLGNRYKEKDQLPLAIAEVEQALRLKPDYAQAEFLLGQLMRRSTRPADAVAHFERAVRFQPDYPEAELLWAISLLETRRPREAIPHLERAIQLKPDNPEAEMDWALALLALNRPYEAIPHFEQAVKLKPDYPGAEMNWAVALANLRRFSEALPHFEKAIALDPDSVDFRNIYGRALAGAGRLNDALTQFNAALRLNPAQAETHLNLHRALSQAGRTEEAAQHLAEAVRLNPALASQK